MKEEKFVIGIYVPRSLVKTDGGAFSYVEVLTEFLLSTNENDLQFKTILEGKNLDDKTDEDEIRIDYNTIRYSFRQKLIIKLFSRSRSSKLKQTAYNIKNNKETKFILRTLKDSGVDLLYYPDQHSALTNQFPFVINNWDLAHITVPPLPDTLRDFRIREKWYNEVAMRAMSIFAESEIGKSELQNFLRIPDSRIKVLPIFAGKVVEQVVSLDDQAEILNTFELEYQNYYFYPAQFWALKNHYHLLKAMELVDFKAKNSFKIVFCGSDKANMDYIKKVVAALNLENRVVFLGFVSNAALYSLYKNCLALVFPSLLGPTNMPILEALALDTPILCSNLEGHGEMLPDYEGMFDPLDAKEIAITLERFIFDSNYRSKLKNRLRKIKLETKFNSNNSFTLILNYFKDIKKIRSLWE